MIKSYRLFLEQTENITPEIQKLIDDIKSKAELYGVEVILKDSKTIPYAIGDFQVSGYFVDYGKPKLAVAIGKPLKEWVMVLAHESSHMEQCMEKSPYWINSFIDGREAVEYIDEWCTGKDFSDIEIEEMCRRSLEVELDCEKRTIQKAIEYNLPVNITEEIQKANSYILFYTFIKDVRKWNTPGKAPHQIKEVWSQMPDSFDMNYDIVPEYIKELYLMYCY